MDLSDYKKLVMLVPSAKIEESSELTVEALKKSLDVFKGISPMTFKTQSFPNTVFLEISSELFEFCQVELQLELGSFQANKFIKIVEDEKLSILILDFETFALNIKESKEKTDIKITEIVNQLNQATDYKGYVEKLEDEFANPILEDSTYDEGEDLVNDIQDED